MTQGSSTELTAALWRAGVHDVDDSTLARALYSSDASLYRVVPQVVVRPRHRDELPAVLEVARTAGVPVTLRGAGTSIAGNAVGPGIVVDCARHLTGVLEVDPAARRARVEPGVVPAVLNRRLAEHGLRFGPDPSTHTRCTVGGMIGNNACGSRALGYGRTADNVAALRLVLGTGDVLDTDTPTGPVPEALHALAADHLATLRTSFGRFSRQVSGYSLEHLLPERGARLDRFLVGSEGTLGLVLDASVDLVEDPPARLLLVLGYPTMAEAADNVPAVLDAARPVACEGLDRRIVDLVRARGSRVPELPRGEGWLFVELTGGSDEECAAAAAVVATVAAALDHRLVVDPDEAAALWRIREDGAGLAARSLGRPAYSGWEDAAVPPARLGAWLRDFEELLDEYGLQTVPYGHFGDGCVHARIDFGFDADGRRRFRDFLVSAATRLHDYGGSISGEHGDGRARSGLLPLMYDDQALRLFAATKAICDPDGILNPGVLVDPAPLDADLRPGRPRHEPPLALRLPRDQGSLAEAVHRCTGVGKCVASTGPTQPGSVMCPSYAATREEKDSTRGRARVLQEALDGALVRGLDDPAVGEALDACLACKGCSSDCPTGVDMAAYKAEVLDQTYRGRRRPRSHYTLGRLPRWLDLAGERGGRLSALLTAGPAARLAKAVAGIDPRRTLPTPAPRTLRTSFGGSTRLHGTYDVPGGPNGPDVWLWADTFTDRFRPEAGHAAIEVLAAAGLRAALIEEPVCCALTWITTGQLDQARDVLTRTVATLAPYAVSGAPILGLEPSCLATLRGDLDQLVADPRAAQVAQATVTLAELLERHGWTPPDLSDVRVLAQPHCHHSSVLGWDADERLLRAAGADLTVVPGCCGLAGSWGMEPSHYELSVAIAETSLLPAVRAHPDAVVLADGLSCRTQLADLAGVRATTLAELLVARLER